MKNLFYTFSILLVITICSCGPGKYVTKDYDRYAKSHRVIAILPYANTYTGRLPKDMSAEEMLELKTEEERELFDRMKAKRLELAKSQNLPPYIIFHDKTLYQFAIQRPKSLEEMSQISGVGERKKETYGQIFLDILSHQ